MNLIILLGLFFLPATQANMVYMKETSQGKTVQWQQTENSPAITLNNQASNEWALYPDVSADGNEFIYCEGVDNKNLHLTYFNKTKNITQKFLHPQKGMILHPKFSKNGRYIFYSAPKENGKNTVFFFDRAALVARQEGVIEYSLEESKAIDLSEESYFPRPSSDGNFIVYQRNTSGKKEIVLFDRLENTKKVLAEGMAPALSFDERTIAFTVKEDGNWNIYTIDRISGEKKQITSNSKDEMAPSFMPDNTLVFASNKSGKFTLYKITNNEWIQISEQTTEADFYSPQFSGDASYQQGLKASFPGNPRSSFGVIYHEGKVYMAGGHQGAEHTYPPESFSDQFFVYDPETNKWTELATRPFKAHGYQLAAHGDYIYAFGGFSYAAEYLPRWKSLDSIDRYSIKENKWETIGNLFSPRSSNVAVKIDNKIYIAGGWNSTPKFKNDADGTFLDTIEIFDLKTEKVELAPYKLPTPKRRALTGMAHKGEIILVGGISEGASHFDLLANVTAINPITGMTRELTPLPFATFAPAAQFLGDELMVFGGMYKTGPMAYEYVAHIYALNAEMSSWRHTGRFLKETKGFSQIIKMDNENLGILGGHHYFEGYDSPVTTFETIKR